MRNRILSKVVPALEAILRERATLSKRHRRLSIGFFSILELQPARVPRVKRAISGDEKCAGKPLLGTIFLRGDKVPLWPVDR
jgi:hypothetical protein